MLGIDIGVETTRAVSLEKQGEKLVLSGLGETKTSRLNWLRGETKNKAEDELVAALKGLFGEIKIKNKMAVASLPEEEVVSRLIRLPPLKKSEIYDALTFEAETFVPYPLDQVTIDYEVVEEDESGRLTLFVVAAKNELIQQYVRLFKKLGLELVALESPSVAICRVVSGMTMDRGVVLVDLGEKFTGINSIDSGRLYLTRSLPVGGESMSRAISLSVGLDMNSAEGYKKAYGLNADELEGKIRTAILPIFSNITDEVRKTVTMFKEERNKAVDLLILTGGGANLPGFAEEFAKLLGVEVQVLQPFVKIDTGKSAWPVDLVKEGCRFTLALGLAMRGIS